MAIERLCIRARPLASSSRTLVTRTWQRPASTDSNTKPPGSAPSAPSGSAPSAAGQTADPDVAVTSFSGDSASTEKTTDFDPVMRAKKRRVRRLPSNAYNFHAPRYYRGPLHPIQPPRPSDPASREFRPGPFSVPRMEQAYNSTLAHDLMTIYYEHVPPGTPKAPPKQRLREWGDESPYYKGRPLRPPRGDPKGRLGLLRKAINWRNVPKLERITVSAIIKEGASSSAHVHTAGMVVQAITGVRAHITKAKKSTSASTPQFRGKAWLQKTGKPISATVDLYGEDMWHFLGTLVNIVMPKIKDFTGVRGRSGDANGNLQLGLAPDLVGGWPEIAVNYDAYPPEMIPGVGITLHSSARTDRDMRLLFAGFGMPFKGNHRTRGP